MTVTDLITLVLEFIQKWMGTTLPRMLAAFLGTLVCVLTVSYAWDRRIRTLGATFLMLAGLVMIAAALDPNLPYMFAATSHLSRIRGLMMVLSFVVLVITIEAIRRSHLQERYALLWVATGAVILITAFFPGLLDFVTTLFGARYDTAVVGIVFTFLLLIAFHFSIALSGYQKKQAQIAQHCAILEQRIEALTRALGKAGNGTCPPVPPGIKTEAGDREEMAPATVPVGGIRNLRGSQVGAPLIIATAVVAVVITGLMNPRPMIGDEVTHYYMVTEQAKDLSHPNFYARIPTGWGGIEVRRYPHPFLWHYLGAILYRLSGGSFAVLQIYQALFWALLLGMAYLLARGRHGVETRSLMVYILVIASLPLCLIFSVALYQDIPATAQVLAAFYFLHRGRFFWATVFLCLAIGFKVSTMLFIPAFLVLMLFSARGRWRWRGALAVTLGAILGLAVFTWGLGWAVKTYAHTGFYPQQKLFQIAQKLGIIERNDRKAHIRTEKKNRDRLSRKKNEDRPKILDPPANRPGNLRFAENYLIYGGGVFWLVVILGGISMIFHRRKKGTAIQRSDSAWLWGTGASYVFLTALFLKDAPDARFFLPGLLFLLLPFSEAVVRLPKAKLLISLMATMAILQGGYVLAKTAQLRRISPPLQAAISYLSKHPPVPKKVFMYPEGNYRLFPVPHEWYFGYRLKTFWQADNDRRIQMLHDFHVGAVVVKKHLIAKADPNFKNLGIYPKRFVRDLRGDPRFEKMFENESVVVFKVPVVKD